MLNLTVSSAQSSSETRLAMTLSNHYLSSDVLNIVNDHMIVFDPNPEDDFFEQQPVNRRYDITKRRHKQQQYAFERVFGPDSTNDQIFRATSMEMVENLLKGYNCSGTFHLRFLIYLSNYEH